MSRYIDADILVETIKFHAENVKCENEFANEVYKLAHEHIVEVVGVQPTGYDPEAVMAELGVVFEQTVAEILDKTESDFTIADFNVKPFADRVCAVVRKGGAE